LKRRSITSHALSLRDLRAAGDAERDRANWAAASYHYMKLLEHEPADAALWLQHGHVLKETGLFAQARRSYERARVLRPEDPEPQLQLAILSKIQGNFDAAEADFEEVGRLGYQPRSFIEGELAFLRRTRSAPPTRASVAAAGTRIYLSSVFLPVPEADPGHLKLFLGGTHYSYAYIMKGYHEALKRAGYECQVVRNPEYVPDIRARSPAHTNLHIGFYPPDGPRYLKGAYNIMCIAWEFERLKTRAEASSYHAFADPVTMLSRAQETWAISCYGAEAARRSGVPNVSAVPTPVPAAREAGRAARPNLAELQRLALRIDRVTWVPLAVWPAMQPTLSQQSLARRGPLLNTLLEVEEEQAPVLFLCVFNVHDFRKQMKPVIEAFVRFAQVHPDAYLLLKVSAIDSDIGDVNSMLYAEQIVDAGEMTAPLVSDRILLTTDALSRDEMNWLYDAAAFYVCTSHGEGQNLPLIEAMGRGVVPVSVDHTAMRDYISPANAIVVPSRSGPLTPRLTLRYGLYGVDTYYVGAADVFAALGRARDLPGDAYEALSGAAVAAVAERFGPESLTAAVNRAIANIGKAAAAPRAE